MPGPFREPRICWRSRSAPKSSFERSAGSCRYTPAARRARAGVSCPPEPPMPKIFISYRREDAPGQAGRLSDRLKQEFGNDNVFIDVDTLLPGDDFVDAIGETLGRCDLM